MRGGEFAAEDVVEKLLKNPRLEQLIYKNPRLRRLGRTQLHELLREYFDFYRYSDHSDYSAMSEKLTELVTRVKEGVVESESEEATMCGAPVTEPCTCDKVEIRGSAEVKQLQPASASLGRYTRTEVSWSDNPVFVHDEDEDIVLSVSFQGAWEVWRDGDAYYLTSNGRSEDEDEDEDEDEEKPPYSTCPSDARDWRVRNATDLRWVRLPLSVVCMDPPVEPPPECCERVRLTGGGAFDGIYESALEEPSAGHRRVYWNAAESLLLAFQKSEWNIGRWAVLPKEGGRSCPRREAATDTHWR